MIQLIPIFKIDLNTAMEFGKVAPSLLETIDFTLPPNGWFTQQLLTGQRSSALNVYVGSTVWILDAWKGVIYPPNVQQKEMLSHYGQHFNTIELNATHYKVYPEASIRKWAEKVTDKDFRFCPKITQSISHYSDLSSERARQLTDGFLNGILAFGKQLGPVFLQLSEKYSPERGLQLLHYLEHWPTDVPLFVEVRHEKWFSDAQNREWLFGHLHRLGIGAVITDTAGRRDCVHMELTQPKTMIRFVGNGKHSTDYTRIDAWVNRINQWITNGLEELYFFMHQPHEQYSPEMSAYFIEKLNEAAGLDLKPPLFITKQQSLFD
jgi:uncharacterized protein YecE (DUF72 family)